MRVPQIVNCMAVEKGMENKGKFHDRSTGDTTVGKKAHLGMKQR